MDKADDALKRKELLDDSLDKLKSVQCNLDKLLSYHMDFELEIEILNNTIRSVNRLLLELKYLEDSYENVYQQLELCDCPFDLRIIDLKPTAKPPIPKDLEQTGKDNQDGCE
ncbi:MAG TPA: hypothetical protein IAC96_07590 [Candidatus Fimimorpha faecalis]|uniref:Uncharacterized protein n=1 Tax=Candidatus Fimimorpha faecalis TaxID=2840824 RepID=A0A9D1EF06_9FIRM|nr:hypothetical protein [Candidatus Fimimorpha faecalis]